MKICRYDRSGEKAAFGLLSYRVATALSLVMALSAPAQVSDFYAYYTRLDYDDRGNTGKYADLVVRVGTTGTFVFSREHGYLPYWQPSQTKFFVDRILPVSGDGPAERPDKTNKCSYVRLIENSPDRIVVHWRYAPNLNNAHFTDFRKSYQGDMGLYFADYAEEYFTITAAGQVTRKEDCARATAGSAGRGGSGGSPGQGRSRVSCGMDAIRRRVGRQSRLGPGEHQGIQVCHRRRG